MKYLDVENRYNLLKKIIKSAGEIALNYFNNRSTIVIEQKSIQDLVSIADKNVEKFITNQIISEFPNDNIFGEEYKLQNNNEQSGIWIIDPIDGTLPFLSGLPHWCVSIAYCYEDEILCAAVYDPLRDELFHALKNNGSYLNNNKLVVNKNLKLEKGFVGLGYSLRIDSNLYITMLRELFKNKSITYLNGSGALMICYCACGRLNAYCEAQLNSWDAAAGLLICEEAGLKTNNFINDNWLYDGNAILVAPPQIYENITKFIPWKI